MKKLFFLTMLVFSASCGAQVCESKGLNIILMTWDGVRNQEFFNGTGILPENKLPRAERGEVFLIFRTISLIKVLSWAEIGVTPLEVNFLSVFLLTRRSFLVSLLSVKKMDAKVFRKKLF